MILLCRGQKTLFTGHTTLFTHLKIILLQCFQFSVFNFSKNKLYPNGYQNSSGSNHQIAIFISSVLFEPLESEPITTLGIFSKEVIKKLKLNKNLI